MRATYVKPELTPATPEHVSRAYRTALTNLVGAPSDMAVAVLHGQGALETGHFKSCYNWNAGNVKSGEQYVGLFTCFPMLNEVIQGRTVWFCPEGELEGGPGTPVKGKHWPVPDGHPQSRFRAYLSLSSGIEDKIRFLAGPHWKPALDKAMVGDAAGYVETVRALGYFTAPLAPYQRAVVSLAQKYLPVAIATREAVAVPPLPPDDLELCRDMAACIRFELPAELAAKVRIGQADHADFALDLVRQARDEEISGE